MDIFFLRDQLPGSSLAIASLIRHIGKQAHTNKINTHGLINASVLVVNFKLQVIGSDLDCFRKK
ncbi:hypothetical protein BVY04_05385 [bacterium M21]|nr:hypothetical protein BVY04_05385 [bacterium M21]